MSTKTTMKLSDFLKEDEVKVTIHHEDRYGRLLQIGEKLYLDFSEVRDRTVQHSLREAIAEQLGHRALQDFRDSRFPIEFLAKFKIQIEAGFAENGYDVSCEPFPKFWAPVSKRFEQIAADFNKMVSSGNIEYHQLPLFFKKGDDVVTKEDGHLVGGKVVEIDFVSSIFGSYLKLELEVVHAYGQSLALGKMTAIVPAFSGLKRIDELQVYRLTDDVKAQLSERGRKFEAVSAGSVYMRYQGEISRAGWFGRNGFRADGRVMVDAGNFARIDHDQHSRENDFEDRYRRDAKVKTEFHLSEDDLWRTYPYVLGFSFRAKKWGRLEVASLSPIEWRDDAFDFLVLPTEEKEIVRSLVQNSTGSFTDIVEEKGGGTIFCLYGPPGQGKTLLAETVAELSHKPLYSVSVGELGTDPGELENRLRVILDVATMWDAVLLIDEADIFLEARDTHDIVRNAMVGVFLRLLEYHQGTLFLTTNRVKNIDPAFFSRISVPLSFSEADFAKRRQIWSNLTEAAGIREAIGPMGLDTLALNEVNGRQVKNAIRIGSTLARAAGREVELDDLMKPLRMAEAFQREVGALV